MKILIFMFLLIAHYSDSIPITEIDKKENNNGANVPQMPEGICPLPKELGYSGFASLMEDCEDLDRYGNDIPLEIVSYVGSSIYVCCPHAKDKISFVFDSEEDEDYNVEVSVENDQTSQSEPCSRLPETTCTDMDQCSDEDYNESDPPDHCGYTADTGKDKVCCKTVKPRTIKPIAKKYGSKNYDCNDFNKHCQVVAKNDPEACILPDHHSFNFMRLGCMKTCDRCGTKGCVDEFEKCGNWTLQGHCVRYAEFMLFHCRESCGACGFRSPLNSEKQVVDNKDFTDAKDPNFYCGEGKAKKDLEPQNVLPNKNKRSPQEEMEVTANPVDDDDNSEFFSYSTNDSAISCGSTIINDRFIIFAAHCQSQFQNDDPTTNFRSIILRDDTDFKEHIEIRRVFVHPAFNFPILYNDIAVAELGRRIIYNYEKFGDSPACISSGKEIIGKAAISQGYGYTELGKVSSELLEGNVTIISNEDCETWIKLNISSKRDETSKYNLHLKKGIIESLVCSVGNYNETTKYWSGPCKGDSGGPLYINFGETPERKTSERRIQTLEGIVSGGIGCGRNIPAWYTRVSSFRPWIDCIIREVNNGHIKEKVERTCFGEIS